MFYPLPNQKRFKRVQIWSFYYASIFWETPRNYKEVDQNYLYGQPRHTFRSLRCLWYLFCLCLQFLCISMFSYWKFLLLFNYFSFENDALSAARVVNFPGFRSSLWRASNPGHEFSHGSVAQGLLREQDAQTIRIQRSGSFRHLAQYNFF